MSFLTNASIRTKILAIVLPLCAVGIVASSVISVRFKQADSVYSNFIKSDNAGLLNVSRANRNLNGLAYNAYQVMALDPASPSMPVVLQSYKENREAVVKRFDMAKTQLPAFAGQIDSITAQVRPILDHIDAAIKFGSADQDKEAKAELAQTDVAIIDIANAIKKFSDERVAQIVADSDDLTSTTNSTIFWSLSTITATFIVGICLALVVVSAGIITPISRLRTRMGSLAAGETDLAVDGMDRKDEVGQMAKAVQVFRDSAIDRVRLERETEANRNLSEQERIDRDRQKAQEAADVQFAVDNLADGLSRLADGDVSHRINKPFTATLDSVRSDFNNSAEKLQSALQSVAENARGIDAGANEIKSAADDLAKRTEQQAAAVEETAAALEEITTTVKNSTHRAQEAGNLVARAKLGAEKSGEVVRDAVRAMEQIAKSANEISNIIGVIDEIAFQTNLLALNAGVEAARAGEAGKGFAVVAQEVRELAQRSANAAKEIKALITTSNAQVQQGVHLVGDTGKALETIVDEVQEINRHVSSIVESAQEQASGLQQINAAVNQMDQDTQKNAAMVEESTAASHGLAREVSSLNQLLSQFKLGQRNENSSTARPVARIVSDRHHPVSPPARALSHKIVSAFSGSAATASKTDQWEEF